MPSFRPRPLRPGDRIRLVSPASPIKPEKLTAATALLEEAGFVVELAPHALDADFHLAGKDEDRARDLQDAFDDPDVAAVMCTRGGYGCARLLPHLDVARMAAAAKLFIGFSDITTLHLALNRHGLPTLHGPMPLTLSVEREPWVLTSWLNALQGDLDRPDDAPVGKVVVPGSAIGEVTGGCLCLLTDSLGTPYALDCAGKIVVIEDVDEPPHRVDAMLTHLLHEGSIRQAAGIVVGEMTRTDTKVDEGIGGRPWREIVTERLGPLGIPMVIDFPLGHAPQMLTLAMGIRAQLNADEGRLTYTEPLCAD